MGKDTKRRGWQPDEPPDALRLIGDKFLEIRALYLLSRGLHPAWGEQIDGYLVTLTQLLTRTVTGAPKGKSDGEEQRQTGRKKARAGLSTPAVSRDGGVSRRGGGNRAGVDGGTAE